MSRKIIHIDMDAFFAAVEQRDNPELRGKPVIVGGRPDSRGVVSTCSYEARKFGVHSAMAASLAYRLCPQCIFIYPNFEAYKEASEKVMEILNKYTERVEQVSIDEAYMDVTYNKKNIPSATEIARLVRRDIWEATALTASAGVSYNKFLAKVASDYRKPDGLTVVTPDKAVEFLAALPIRKFHGIGSSTEEKMKAYGIRTGRDLQSMSLEKLSQLFGKHGAYYYSISRGMDDRDVKTERDPRKSLGKERTFSEDIGDMGQMMEILASIAGRISEKLHEKRLRAKTVTLKVRYANFQSITRAKTLSRPIDSKEEIMQPIPELLSQTEAGQRKVRLLGISTSNFVDMNLLTAESMQLYLPFDIV